MSVCVQLYNTGWNVFSIEILGGGICLLCEKSPSHLPFYRGKQVPEDDKETDEDLKKVCTCSQIPLTPVHMYCTHCARLPHSTATLPKWYHSKVPRLCSRCLCDKDQGVLFSCAHMTVISPVSLTFSGVLPGICCSGLCGVHQWRHQGVCE